MYGGAEVYKEYTHLLVLIVQGVPALVKVDMQQ
jgi:hypothetical protein